MEKTLPEIGKVRFRKSQKAKHVNITVKPFEDVVVSVPRKVSIPQAEQVLQDNLAWVKREKVKMKEVEARYTTFESGEKYQFKDIEVLILSSESLEKEVETKGNQLIIHIPGKEDIKNTSTQQFIRDQVEKEIRKRAKFHLPERARSLAEKNSIPVRKISVRKSTTRWGSCSQKNNLSLSYFLYLLPDHLIDYVILHELAHVKIKDHSKAYWMHLESLVKDAKRLDREIKGWVNGVI